MAIIYEVPGLTVRVEIDGTRAEEFPDPDSPDHHRGPTAVRYIEATTGARFCIVLYIDHEELRYAGDGISAELFLDGQYTGRSSFPRQDSWPIRRNVIAEKTTHLSDSIVGHSFLFSELRITEDEPDFRLQGSLAQLGTISVCLHRFRYLPYRDAAVPFRPHGPALPPNGPNPSRYLTHLTQAPALRYANIRTELVCGDEVPEKNLKGSAVSHQAKLSYAWESAPEQQPPFRLRREKEIIGREPVARFTFKYRSRRALQNLLVLPRSISPTLRASEDAVNVIGSEDGEIGKEAVVVIRPKDDPLKDEPDDNANANAGNDGNRSDCQRLKRESDWDVNMDYGKYDDEEDVEVVEERPGKVRRIEYVDLTLDDEDDDAYWVVAKVS